MSAEKKQYATGLLLLFLAELLSLIGSFDALTPVAAPFKYLAALSLAGFVLMLVGVIMLRDACVEFNRVFVFVISSLILQLVALIFGFFPALALIGDILSLLVTLVSIAIFFYAILGCKKIATLSDGGKYADLTLKVCLFLLVAVLIMGILRLMPFVVDNFAVFLGILITVADVAASVFFVILLFKTFTALKK